MTNNSFFSNSNGYISELDYKITNKIFGFLNNKDDNKIGLILSFIFHVSIMTVAIGIPSCFQPKSILVPNIIPIEILNIEEVTRMPNILEDPTSEKKLEKQNKKEERFSSSEETEIIKKQKVDEKIEEDIPISQEVEKIEKTEDLKIKIPEEKPLTNKIDYESIPTKEIKPKIKPKPQITKKEQSDVVVRIKPKPKKDFSIASVLKDLRKENVELTNKLDDSDDKAETQENNDQQKNTTFSISEIDLLKQQLYACWTVPAGAKGASEMEVKVRVWVNPDKTVNSVRILDTNRMQNDPYFRTVAESTLRAILNPACSPLKLPDGKYDIWKKFIFVFELGWMLGN